MTIKQHGGVFGRNPSFNDVSVETLSIAGTALSSTAAELNILDGVTATTAELNILDGVTATTAELNILDGVTADATELNYLDGASTSAVVASKAVLADSSGNVAFPNGKGIDFSATGDGSGTASNELFADYEEGTWTPAFDLVTVTHTTQTGTYVKIGDMVYGYCRIVVSSIDNTDGSAVSISGLPYAPAVTGNGGGTFHVGYNQTPLFNSTAADDVTGLNFSTSGSFQFGDASFQFFRRYVDLCNASGELLVSFFYRAS